ncbi:hypothetical protein Tco_0937912 [Tanacetum coccineum]|uniref:Uncharacterized protein n=1 Tax=Tanacetum coccineum TaxID=301880 RepID=A0ABQ5DGM0_9ASTR
MDIFIKGALWDYWKMGGDEIETPLCLAFNEFNYLLKVDLNLLTKEIMGFKTYEDYKDDWIYEWNENVPWLGVRNGQPVVGEMMVIVMEEIYPVLTLLETRSITKTLNGIWLCNDCCKRWKSHEIYYHDYDEGEYENETHEEGHELCGIETREVSVFQIKRYKVIKYLFNNDEEYVAVKEDEYDDITITSEEACRAYQEIFWMMNE